jgi:hypothetical protein
MIFSLADPLNSSNPDAPFCFTEYLVDPRYSNVFSGVECAAVAGSVTAYATYTNAVNTAITPQVTTVANSSPSPALVGSHAVSQTVSAAPDQTAGSPIIINCGQNGSDNTKCNVEPNNNGNIVNNSAGVKSIILGIRSLVQWLAFWLFKEMMVL